MTYGKYPPLENFLDPPLAYFKFAFHIEKCISTHIKIHAHDRDSGKREGERGGKGLKTNVRYYL